MLGEALRSFREVRDLVTGELEDALAILVSLRAGPMPVGNTWLSRRMRRGTWSHVLLLPGGALRLFRDDEVLRDL